MEIAEGIHHFPTGPFNWYVIEENSRLTLVDAGFPGHYRIFEAGLRTIGRELKDVEGIVLTHAHADHMGFANRAAVVANAPVLVHASDLAAAQKRMQLPWFALLSNAWRPYTATMLATATWNGVFNAERIPNPQPFQDGDVLAVPGRPIVIHTPGHTPGEVSLYLPRQRVLISGDTLVTRNLYTGRSGSPQLTSPQLNDDYREARRSLSRLNSLGRVKILPGHGQPWEGDITEAIDLALR